MLKFDRAIFTAFVAERIEDKATREAIFDLLEFALENALKVVGGASNTNFHYVVGTSNGSAMLFYCDASGGVQMSLGNFPELSTATVSKFLRNLGSSPGYKYVRRFEDRRLKGGTQGFLIKETLVDPTIMKKFKSAVIELQRTITEG